MKIFIRSNDIIEVKCFYPLIYINNPGLYDFITDEFSQVLRPLS